MGAGYHGGFGNTAGENKHKKAIGNRNPIHKRLIDENLIKELRKNNIKFSEKDILFITKDKTNQIVWLEKGNDGAGFEHIKSRHGRDFAKTFNFSENTLHESLYKVIKYGNVVDDHIEIRNGISSITRVYDYQGTYYLLTGIGTNGFIVTARPQKRRNDMKIVKLDLDYLMGPILGDVYSVELHKSITGIKIIDDDRILQQLHDKIQDMFFSYYEFNKNGQACWFNKEQQLKEKDVMMELLGKLKARLDEINDGSFEVVDLITPEYANL